MPVLALLLLLLALPAAPARAQPAASFADPRLVEDFITIALGAEFPQERTRPPALIRWARPIRATGTGPQAERWADGFAWHVRRLARITGHPIELRRSGEVDLIAIFVPSLTAAAIGEHAALYRRMFSSEARFRDQMARIASGALNAVCFTTVRTNDRYEITAAVAFIPLDRGATVLRQCIIEELTQAMGLPNDDDGVDPSIFNDRSPYIELTGKDIIFLRLLYHRSLRPGMSADAIRAAAPAVLNDLRRRPFRE